MLQNYTMNTTTERTNIMIERKASFRRNMFSAKFATSNIIKYIYVMENILKKRFGVTRPVSMQLILVGDTTPLEERNIKVFLQTPSGSHLPVYPSLIEGDTIQWSWNERLQPRLGKYSIMIVQEDAGVTTSIVDYRDFCELVPFDDNFSVEAETIEISEMKMLSVGIRGMDAYEQWLANGHEGTKDEYEAWLRKPAQDVADYCMQLIEKLEAAEEERVSDEQARCAAETERKESEEGRTASEELRQASEQERLDAEQERVTNEQERFGAEANRINEEEERILNENVRKVDETERNLSENERKKNEDSRIQAEQKRQTLFETNEITRNKGENERESNEKKRKNNETTRAVNENVRVESEKARQRNEEERTKTFDKLNLDIANTLSEARTLIEEMKHIMGSV